MSDSPLSFPNTPIVEAVADIDCDMPPGFELAALEAASRDLFRDSYPKFQIQLIQEHEFKQKKGDASPEHTMRNGMQAFQFRHDDGKQLVQVRRQGFSFNRLAPYSSLDTYLPEIERTWKLFVQLAKPVQIRCIRLRYINRILLPITEQRLSLREYLKVSPRLLDEDNLTFVGFLNQHTAVETATKNQVKIILTTQPIVKDHLPLIFDIEASYRQKMEVGNWPEIAARITSLRSLKNRVFKNTLTDKCLNLFH